MFGLLVVFISFTKLLKEYSLTMTDKLAVLFFAKNVFKIALLFYFACESERILLETTGSELKLYIECAKDC